MLLPSALFCLQLLLSQNVRQTVKTIIQTHTQTHRGCIRENGNGNIKGKIDDAWWRPKGEIPFPWPYLHLASCILHIIHSVFRFLCAVCCVLWGHWAIGLIFLLGRQTGSNFKPTHRHTDRPTSVLGSVHLSWNFWEEKAVSVCVYSSIRLTDLLRTALW